MNDIVKNLKNTDIRADYNCNEFSNFLSNSLLSKLPGDLGHVKQALKAELEVMQYLHSKVEEHIKTLDPSNPRDNIDKFLIEKNLHSKLHPGQEDKTHYFTGAYHMYFSVNWN